MKKILLIMVAGLILSMSSLAYGESNQPWSGNARLLLGGKFLDKDDWAPRGSQYQIGGLFDIRPNGWPVSIALDVLYSRGSSNSVEAGILEANLGVRKYFENDPKLRIYAGGGLAFMKAILDVTLRNAGDDDNGFGIWLDFGFDYLLTERITIGGDLRYSAANVSIFNAPNIRIGGLHAGLTLGYKF
jgi:opacity protein-like surface antigen